MLNFKKFFIEMELKEDSFQECFIKQLSSPTIIKFIQDCISQANNADVIKYKYGLNSDSDLKKIISTIFEKYPRTINNLLSDIKYGLDSSYAIKKKSNQLGTLINASDFFDSFIQDIQSISTRPDVYYMKEFYKTCQTIDGIYKTSFLKCIELMTLTPEQKSCCYSLVSMFFNEIAKNNNSSLEEFLKYINTTINVEYLLRYFEEELIFKDGFLEYLKGIDHKLDKISQYSDYKITGKISDYVRTCLDKHESPDYRPDGSVPEDYYAL